ncbi:hypothetical protein CQW23_21208 [Capsicum baccatum]|uniref:Uncharacterized protein n=1 Tax=Capsicum baccatum TaxID=33114 RepID=A0A2G2VXD3_CAPBA|nr:hypothetical protein CQW23_21208 [Capsicum baccatum]
MTDYEIRHQKAKKEFHPLRDDEDVGLPFLIITTSAALPLWEAEFSCWTGVNVVYQDSQLSPVTYVSKMYQDKCATRFNSCSVLSLLDTKYNKANNELLNTDSDLDLTEFKKRLKHFVAYECKSSSSKFIEYWVPVKLSNEPIEQYCTCLFDNSTWLCSSMKNDSPSCVDNILKYTRKSHDGSGVYSIRNILSDLIPKKFGGD